MYIYIAMCFFTWDSCIVHFVDRFWWRGWWKACCVLVWCCYSHNLRDAVSLAIQSNKLYPQNVPAQSLELVQNRKGHLGTEGKINVTDCEMIQRKWKLVNVLKTHIKGRKRHIFIKQQLLHHYQILIIKIVHNTTENIFKIFLIFLKSFLF